ncbi:uncharacterized protein [Lolium perenne]|uniref:uncharacterized protein n=1 Tax=Lolium perenne TaxID=4522 RepID=UPI0021F57578|nr:uncharacterized protein LOC127328560 [Lolium perenne]
MPTPTRGRPASKLDDWRCIVHACVRELPPQYWLTKSVIAAGVSPLIFSLNYPSGGNSWIIIDHAELIDEQADYIPPRYVLGFKKVNEFFLLQGVRPFVELAPAVVCSLDFNDSLEDTSFTAYPWTTLMLFEPLGVAMLMTMGKAGGGGVVGSAWSRFVFSMSDNALKPWYLSTTPAAPVAGPCSMVASSSPSFVGVSPLTAHSFSFASPAARSIPQPVQQHRGRPMGPTPSVAKGHKAPSPAPILTLPPLPQQFLRTPWSSFLQSPFMFRKDGQSSHGERERESFMLFLGFCRRPYAPIVDEKFLLPTQPLSMKSSVNFRGSKLVAATICL